jgi:predicted secreted Zn-dependent protease
VQREDDTEEAIRNRLKLLPRADGALEGLLRGEGHPCHVDASKAINEVTQEVLKDRRRRQVDLDRPQEQERAGGDARGRQNHRRLPRAAL